MMRFWLTAALIATALPTQAQVQLQLGGTAGFGSRSTTTTSPTLGDFYGALSLRLSQSAVGPGLSTSVHAYTESLSPLRRVFETGRGWRDRDGFHGTGAAFRVSVDSGYLGLGAGSYGWRGTGVRYSIGWPTTANQVFELSLTQLWRGDRPDPVFTYGVRF